MTDPWHDLGLRVVTPAFLGRFAVVDPGPAPAPASFPVPSLRGVLAYWLRALAGAHLGDGLEQVHAVESAVFGAARTEHSGGPSPVQLRGGRVRFTKLTVDGSLSGLRYLMGPGLTSDPPPRCLAPGQVELRVRNSGPPAVADLFLAALWALRSFGGVGARTRRGFGTLAIDQVPDLAVGQFDLAWLGRDRAGDLGPVLDCVAAAIRALGIEPIAALADGVPRYPCFAASRYLLSADDEDRLPGAAGNWKPALNQAGDWLWAFRHGADRRVPESRPASGVHSQTYSDVVQPFLNNPARYTQRGPATAAALGLPIPYSDHQGPRDDSGQTQRRATLDVLIGDQPARRASPLWLRVRHDGDTWRLRSLAFESEWLPSNAQLRIAMVSGPQRAPVGLLSQAQVREELNRWFGLDTSAQE